MAKTRPKTPKTKPKGGRPTALTAVIHRTIVDAIRNHASIRDAATLAGVHERTVQRWIADAKVKGGAFARFAREVEQARAQAKQSAIGMVAHASRDRYVFPTAEELVRMGIDPDDKSPEGLKARARVRPKFVPGDWKAARFFLQTRYPDEFAEPGRRVEVTGAGGGPVDVSFPALDGLDAATLIALAYGPGNAAAVLAAASTVQDDEADDE